MKIQAPAWRLFPSLTVVWLIVFAVVTAPRPALCDVDIDTLVNEAKQVLSDSQPVIDSKRETPSDADLEVWRRVLALSKRVGEAMKKDSNLAARADVRNVRSDLTGMLERFKAKFGEVGFSEMKKKVELSLGGTLKASGAGQVTTVEAPKEKRPWKIEDMPDRSEDDATRDQKWLRLSLNLYKLKSPMLVDAEAKINDLLKPNTPLGKLSDFYFDVFWRGHLASTGSEPTAGDERFFRGMADAYASFQTTQKWTLPTAKPDQIKQDEEAEKLLEEIQPITATQFLDSVAAKTLPQQWAWLEKDVVKQPLSQLRQRHTQIQDNMRGTLLEAKPAWTSVDATSYNDKLSRLCHELYEIELAIVWYLGMTSVELETAYQTLETEGYKFSDEYKRAQEGAYLAWTYYSYLRHKLKFDFAIARMGGQGGFDQADNREKSLNALKDAERRIDAYSPLRIEFTRSVWGERLRRGLERAREQTSFKPHVLRDSPYKSIYGDSLDRGEVTLFYNDAGFFRNCNNDQTYVHLLYETEMTTFREQGYLRQKASPKPGGQ